MKIVMFLVVVLACGAAGAFIGGSLTSTDQVQPTNTTGMTADERVAEGMQNFAAGADIQRRRQTNLMIGGGVGLAVGVALAFVLVSRRKS